MDILDREWEGQSVRREPLAMTAPVREAIELVFAGTPGGIFAVAPDMREPADSTHAAIDRLRDRLPCELPAWNMRALRRVEGLVAVQPWVPAPEVSTRGALPPAPTLPQPTPQPAPPPADEPAPLPGAPAVPEERAALSREPGSIPTPERAFPGRAAATVAAGGLAAGASCGLVTDALGISVVIAGTIVGALAAIFGLAVGSRGRIGGQK